MNRSFAEIAVTLPVRGQYHYEVPESLQDQLQIGHRVLVPFGQRRVTGFVLKLDVEIDAEIIEKIRPISSRMDEAPLVPQDVLQLASFCADYYLCTIGEVLKMALPPGLTAASVVRLVATPDGKRWLQDEAALSSKAQLNKTQTELLNACAKGLGIKGAKARSRAADVLVELGLAARKDNLAARTPEAQVEIVERLLDPKAAWPLIQRAPSRREIYARLEAGPLPVPKLIDLFGRAPTRSALKRMTADGVVRVYEVPKASLPKDPSEAEALQAHLDPTPEQANALAELVEAFDAGAPPPFLLQGVTGSGKTEVYLRIIAHARETGKGAVVLVPEIALTPQLEERFRARFGDEVVVLHSALTDTQRRVGWQRLRKGEASIAVGPRSALWAPVHNLGVIVVDEEHDASFKQGSDVRYNGRDLALVRAHQTHSLAILGSATPSLESLHLAAQDRLQVIHLKARVGARPMPKVSVVDLTEERRQRKGDVSLISRPLADALREVIAKKEQAILFLNRRGFNTIVYCQDCSEPRRCPRCSISLTHHLRAGNLACHYCGYEVQLESPCPECKSMSMQPMGAGTERVVEAVAEEVPGARIVRLDRDVTQKAGAMQATLQAFRDHEADILVGTQMVAKGHDFPKVTLVGIVLADASLAFPDFRAAERTFQLLTQVAGRAGRADAPGRVLVQTLQPDHYALQAAVEHDVERFVGIEAPSREDAGYPPYGRMGLIRIESKDCALAQEVAEYVAKAARAAAGTAPLRIVGPAPAPIERLRERWRFRIMLMAEKPAHLVATMRRVQMQFDDLPRKVDLIFDVDPLDML